MKELILHGGLGIRLNPLSSELPKGFIPIRNKSTVERILEQSRGLETTIIIPKGDEKIPEIIERRGLVLATIEALEFPMQAVVEYLDKVNEPVMVWWGDTLASIDVAAMVLHHELSGADATMALWETTLLRELKHWGSVTLNGHGLTIDHPVPDVSSKGLIKTGVFIFNPSVSKIIRKIATETWDMSKILNRLLFAKQFSGFVYRGYRVNLNYGYDLIKAASMIGDFERRSTQDVHPTASLEGRVELGQNVSVGENVVITEGVHISNSIILEGSVIEKRSTVVNSVIGPRVIVPRDSFISRKMMVGKSIVDLSESPY